MILGIIVIALMFLSAFAGWYVGAGLECEYWEDVVRKLNNKIRRIKKWQEKISQAWQEQEQRKRQ